MDLPKSAKVKVGRAVSSGFCCIVALRLHEKGLARQPLSRADDQVMLRYVEKGIAMAFCTDAVCVGEGVFALEAVVTVTPRGIVVYACTPAFAHVGATAQAIPRPEPGRTATVSLLAVPCHRDEIPAHDIAAALATKFAMPCSASTGYHVENASPADLQKMLEANQQLIGALEERVAVMLASLGE